MKQPHRIRLSVGFGSRPARGVWIETSTNPRFARPIQSHAPRGACGLKLPTCEWTNPLVASRPARGVWIETSRMRSWSRPCRGHAPRGACGLKRRVYLDATRRVARHAPRGACGLKLISASGREDTCGSRPARGVWIETTYRPCCQKTTRSRPARGVWIETAGAIKDAARYLSRPARGVWIETFCR